MKLVIKISGRNKEVMRLFALFCGQKVDENRRRGDLTLAEVKPQ